MNIKIQQSISYITEPQNKFRKNSSSQVAPSEPETGSCSQKPNFSGYYTPVYMEKNDALEFRKKLYSLENIHCPICGIKMLSIKEAQNLIKQGANIKNPVKFSFWLSIKRVVLYFLVFSLLVFLRYLE